MTERTLTDAQRQMARDRARAWHWANRERALATGKRRYQERPEEYRARSMLWRKMNPEKARENDRKKRANRSPEYLAKRAVDEQNRRARIKANGGRLSRDIIKTLFAAQAGKCVYCRCDISIRHHLDHIVAIAAGGRNDDDNVQLLCPSCNRRKHIKPADEFARSVRL